METLESLAGQLETTADIKSIVRTMKSLSAVSIRQYEQAEEAMSGYEGTIDLAMTAILRERRSRGLPLPKTIEAGSSREALLVIGSDRGLCGSYNEIVTRHATARMTEHTEVLAVAGARAAARLEAVGHRAAVRFALPGSVSGLSPLVQNIIIEVERWTRDEGVGRVRLVHNRRDRQARATPVERALLPIPESYLRALLDAGWPGSGLPFFRTAPEALLSRLVRERLFVVLFRAFAGALASEHATRLSAMQSAERNIDERQDSLNSAFRQKRQETITRELMDVVSGFEAVSSSGE